MELGRGLALNLRCFWEFLNTKLSILKHEYKDKNKYAKAMHTTWVSFCGVHDFVTSILTNDHDASIYGFESSQ